jgi:hypothetical protein
MPEEFHAFDQQGAKRIIDSVRSIENQTTDLGRPNDDNDQLFQIQGKMTTALAAGTSFGQNPPTATMQVYIPDESNDRALVDAGYSVTLTNRDPGLTKSIDSWCRAVFVNGEWQPVGCVVRGDDDEEYTCACWWYETEPATSNPPFYFRVPCYFKTVSPFPSFCGESVTTFCFLANSVSNYLETGVGYSKQANTNSPYSANGNGLHLWYHPSESECESGPQFLEPIGAGWQLLPLYDFTDSHIDWELRLVPSGSVAGNIATWRIENWDPWGTRNDGTFTLETPVDEEWERITCRTTLTPNVSNNLAAQFPSTLTLRPHCFQPGCSNQEAVFGEIFPPAGSCYPDDTDCEVGNESHDYYGPCDTQFCEWTYDSVTETYSSTDNCTDVGCGCGPGPVCGEPSGPPYPLLTETCYESVSVSEMSMTDYSSIEQYNADSEPTVKEPPLLRKIRNAASQLIESGKQVAHGGKLVAPEEVQQERMAICQACEHSGFGARTTCGDVLRDDGTLAKGCGCQLALAIATAAKSCPIGKWSAVD